MNEGVLSLAPPDTRLKVQVGLAFMAFVHDQAVMRCFVWLCFRTWATNFGVVWNLRSLHNFQLGPVPYASMGFLALPVKSSQARHYCLDGIQLGASIGDLPLAFSYFRNSDNLCLVLIRKGIPRISHLFNEQYVPRQ